MKSGQAKARRKQAKKVEKQFFFSNNKLIGNYRSLTAKGTCLVASAFHGEECDVFCELVAQNACSGDRSNCGFL